jgi:hypothetical protein
VVQRRATAPGAGLSQPARVPSRRDRGRMMPDFSWSPLSARAVAPLGSTIGVGGATSVSLLRWVSNSTIQPGGLISREHYMYPMAIRCSTSPFHERVRREFGAVVFQRWLARRRRWKHFQKPQRVCRTTTPFNAATTSASRLSRDERGGSTPPATASRPGTPSAREPVLLHQHRQDFSFRRRRHRFRVDVLDRGGFLRPARRTSV